jgi:ABC-type multidrug transport system fused ATPase/permease subunit
MGATVFLEQTLPSGASTLFPLILAPMALYWMYGFELHGILLIMTSVISINTFLAFMQSKFFLKFKQLAAERTGIVNEWIQNLRTLRILGWVEAFEKKIFNKREVETQNRISMVTNGQLMNSISSSITFVINIVSIIALVDHFKTQPNGKVISPGELLSLLWILGVFLTRPFRQMPWFFTFGFDGLTSTQRLADFFSLNNISHQFPTTTAPDRKVIDKNGPSIEVYGLHLRIDNKEILKDISFEVHPQELIAIVGEVGCGKSSLLLSLMGETSANFKKYKMNGQNILSHSQADLCQYFSFVPQEGFIMSASLRDNIVFDYQASPQLDNQISQSLAKAQFQLNTEGLPDGLNTEIGERGVNLSGGQKQRINLARADYFESPIVLLDDSFSAVDIDTEKHLVAELINGRWAHKTRIIATHRLSLLKIVNRVLFMADGQIKEFAPLDELFMKSPEFREFTSSLEKKELKERKNAKIH